MEGRRFLSVGALLPIAASMPAIAQPAAARTFTPAPGDWRSFEVVHRVETAQWIKTTDHPVVAPVHKALFGSWEGNWLAYNMAHDVVLPGAKGPKLPFLMYPQAETSEGRLDPYDPDNFKYTISTREIKS